MSLVRYKARNHPQQLVDPDVDDRGTTLEDFRRFDTAMGPFTLDVAATAANTKCARYFTAAQDGLAQSWAGERVWCNPPYSSILPWVQKAWAEWKTSDGIAMLLPANRTEQNWWQHLIEPHRDRAGSPLRVLFLPGRMRFLRAGQQRIGPNERPPFGCLIAAWALDPSSVLPAQPSMFEAVADAR